MPFSLFIKLETLTAILNAFSPATTVPPAIASSEKFLITKVTGGLIFSSADLVVFTALGNLLSSQAPTFSVASGTWSENHLRNLVT